jgi:hypothetical protein
MSFMKLTRKVNIVLCEKAGGSIFLVSTWQDRERGRMWQELESGVELRGNNGLRATIITVKRFSAASEQLTEEPYEYL